MSLKVVLALVLGLVCFQVLAQEFMSLEMFSVEKFIFRGDEYHIKLTIQSSTNDDVYVQLYRKSENRREYVNKFTLTPVKNNFGEFSVSKVVTTLVKSYPGERYVEVCAFASSVNGSRDEKCSTVEIEE